MGGTGGLEKLHAASEGRVKEVELGLKDLKATVGTRLGIFGAPESLRTQAPKEVRLLGGWVGLVDIAAGEETFEGALPETEFFWCG